MFSNLLWSQAVSLESFFKIEHLNAFVKMPERLVNAIRVYLESIKADVKLARLFFLSKSVSYFLYDRVVKCGFRLF